MTPSYHPFLVNGRYGDPALFVDFRFEKRAVLFDLGDLHELAPRKILRVSHVFLSHTHIDHFIGFDQLLRVVLDRDKHIAVYGPDGTIDRVAAKLDAYSWNLTDRFKTDLTFRVTEVVSAEEGRSAQFRLQARFRREAERSYRFEQGVVLMADNFQVEAALLDHKIPCLGFAMKEKSHVNVRKNRLDALDLPVGPWLNELKQAVMDGCPDETPILVYRQSKEYSIRQLPLGLLAEQVVHVTPGQKVAYITDVAYTPPNVERIQHLARDADLLFIEAPFKREDAAIARDRAHLTTAQAGALARSAGVRRVEPFHFSPRYEGEEAVLLGQVEAAFQGRKDGADDRDRQA